MRRAAKIAGYVAGGLAVVAVAASTVAFTASNRKLNLRYDTALTMVEVPTDEESVSWGSHLVNTVTGCRDCHGADLSGTVMGDDAAALIAAPNLTRGQGGIGGQLTTQDWVRAIRHGVKADGRSLLVMPSYAYANLSDVDLGAMIAYLQQLPPVDHEVPAIRLRPMGRFLVAAGVFDEEFTAKKVPQRTSYDAVDRDLSMEYGKYLADISGCTSCHSPDLKGGRPSGPPGAPAPPDISPTGLAQWSQQDFFVAMREGRRPDGSEISEFMPWRFMSAMQDDELEAIWLYLRSVN
jgi:mono/diheme cytochrome c family protein